MTVKPLKPKDRARLQQLVRLKRQKAEQDLQVAQAAFEAIKTKILKLQRAIAAAQSPEGGFGADSLVYQAAHIERLLNHVEIAQTEWVELKREFDLRRTELAKALLALDQLATAS
ncbi:MAG: hypothetical protein AAFO63_08710 [Pseudomonadota bacterium]